MADFSCFIVAQVLSGTENLRRLAASEDYRVFLDRILLILRVIGGEKDRPLIVHLILRLRASQ